MLGLLRLMAYNLALLIRRRYLLNEHRAEKRRGQKCCEVLFLLICLAGRDLFPHRQTTAGIG